MRPVRTLVVGSLLAALLVAVPSAAHAVAPSSATWSPVAPRHEGDGYAATAAVVDPRNVSMAADGGIVLYDRTAARIRLIDASTGVITSLAGDGSPVSHCGLTAGTDARTIALPEPRTLAPAPDGDLFVLMAGYYACDSPGVARLDHTDHQWHLVAAQPSSSERYTKGYGDFTSVAVGSDGTAYVGDGFGHRILAYAPGSDPTAMGTVVAGTGTAGLAGDGGPATSAQVVQPHLLAGPGALYMFDSLTEWNHGSVARRLDLASGVITRIAGTGTMSSADPAGPNPAIGQSATSVDLTIESMGVDQVSGLVALGLLRQSPTTAATQRDLVALDPGGSITAVRTSVDASVYTDPGIAVQHTGSRVLAYGYGELRAWRTSGADAGGSGTVVAGLGSAASATGAALEDAFPGQLTSIATSSSGAVALSGANGVRTVSSLSATAPVTVVSGERASAVDYATDGSLWWARDTTSPAIFRKSGGTTTLIVGGGAGTLADGAASTSVALPAIVDVAVDSARGVAYFLAESGVDNPTYVGRRFVQLWSVTTADSTLHLIAGDGSAGTLVTDGQSALTASLGDANALAVDTAHVPLVSTDSGVFRVSEGSMHGPIGQGFTKPMAVTSAGTIISRGQVLAADGTWSGVQPQTGYDLMAPLPDGSWVGATQGTSGSLLVRSDVVTPATGTPVARATVVPGEGTLTITVTPPAAAGLSVSVYLNSSPGWTWQKNIDTFVTDGSTTAHTYLLRRYGPTTSRYDAPLQPGTSYRVDVTTMQSSSNVGASVVAFGSPLPDITAPPAPTDLSWGESLGSGPHVVLTPGDAPDVDHVVVCEQKGTGSAASPTTCSGDSSATGTVTSPTSPTTVLLTTNFQPGGYSPLDERTFTAWTVDLQGNASVPTALTVPGATASTDPGTVPGIEWAWDAGSHSAMFRFRDDPAIGAIVVGSQPPPVPAPYGGVNSGRTWMAYGLTPGQTYTVAFYRWSSDMTHYTPTTATFVAGTSSSDAVSVIAPATVAYGAQPVVKAVVRRAVSGGAVGAGVLPGMPVELWRRTGTSTTWVQVGSGTTGADGTASWTLPAAAATSTYQARIPAQGYMYPAVGTSTAVVVGVKPIEKASLSSGTLLARSVRVGAIVPMVVRVTPKRPMTVWVQRYVLRKWRTVLVTRTSSVGVLVYKLRLTARGTTLLRVVTPATATFASSASNAVTIKAS